jgi:alkaline phosphatase
MVKLPILRNIIVFTILVFNSIIFTYCQPIPDNKTDKSEVRNIILLIGDGMGLPAVYATMTVSPAPLNFERCTYTGLAKTFSLTDYITDSAAGATALSSGKKTKNGVIGQDTLGRKFKSILEIAEEHGLSTGLVSTSAITHATPAGFIAHVPSRDLYEDIALEFLKTDIDVFIGGGINHFYRRTDKLNLLDSLRARGYEVDTTLNSILNSKSSKLAGLNVPEHNPWSLNGRGDMLPLSSRKAIDILSKNPKGFFLMIEGSQIDWAAHGNDQKNLIAETLDFDKAIGIAIDFAEKDGHTLVIVTADHETGGVTITGGDLSRHEVILNFSTTNHTAVMVPVYAFGPGAENFTGIFDNTAIFEKMMKVYGFQLKKGKK